MNEQEMMKKVLAMKAQSMEEVNVLVEKTGEIFDANPTYIVLKGVLEEHLNTVSAEAIMLLILKLHEEVETLRKQCNALASIVAEK